MRQKIDHTDNIIFDLGGVILNIDPLQTVSEMQKLGLGDFDAVYAHLMHTHILDKLEKGLLTQREFLDEIKGGRPLSDEQILKAWNALLLDFPQERIRLLERLKGGNRYRTFLLSNTNAIHYQIYTRMLQDHYGIEGLEALFDKAYFSHELHMRKPDTEIYEHVIRESGLDPERTLFIDDSKANVEAARAVGIHAYHLDGTATIIDLFPEQLTAI
ncbi:MAG: HAD family phosphatase [Bacteroidales bacterium]|nr:HAD family phosphatase [Bacteroidales bacterium]